MKRTTGIEPPSGCCRHCGRRRSLRNRGLCWGCHGDLAIREEYDVLDGQVTDLGKDGGRNPAERSLPLGEPTTALPGTAAKVAVMVERVRLGQATTHPNDATGTEDCRDHRAWAPRVPLSDSGELGKSSGLNCRRSLKQLQKFRNETWLEERDRLLAERQAALARAGEGVAE